MKTFLSMTKRNIKLFFKDKGMFFTSLITPVILLVLYSTFLAKVYRDNLMVEYAKKYPNYDFEHNVGYGTKKHIEAIKQNGITQIHRLSFLSNIIGENECKRIRMERLAK